ncbi:MAG: methyl-accepting chemotaxis protein [Planctomycetota bacterium]
MTIRNKLILAIATPLMLLIGFSVHAIVGQWHISNDMVHVEHLAEFSMRASALIHETQKERGATAGYLGSEDGVFDERLASQRKLTDEQLVAYGEFLADFPVSDYPNEFTELIASARHEIDNLPNKRAVIWERSIPAGDAIGFYTNLNGLLLDAIEKSAQCTNDSEIAVRIHSFACFLKSKERAGIERAVLANTFASDRFGTGMYRKFIGLVALQDAFMDQFRILATEHDRAFYDDAVQVDAFADVLRHRTVAFDNPSGGFNQDATEWFDTITRKINVLKTIDDHLAQGLYARAESKARRSSLNLLLVSAGTALVVILVVAAGWISIRSITVRLKTVSERVRDIAEGEADLTARLEVSTDEIGELSEWFNQLLDRIEQIVIRVTRTSKQLSDSAAQLVSTAVTLKSETQASKDQSSSISAAAEEMSANIDQTATATSEMSVGINGVSKELETIRASINDITIRSKKSATIAKDATKCVRQSDQQINELGEAAKEIGKVVDVIEDIAEQTNLLALNATIEAARAGDAGKGFAVVATEVKELANMTANATDGIRQRVVSMQAFAKDSIESVSSIDEVIRDVHELADSIADAVHDQGESVSTIASSMAQSSDASHRIATVIRESAGSSRTITESVTAVDTTLGLTAEGAELTHGTGSRVAELAEELQLQISQFKCRDEI